MQKDLLQSVVLHLVSVIKFESMMERTEMRMIRWMCGVSRKGRQSSTELRCRLKWGYDEKRQTEMTWSYWKEMMLTIV